MDLIARKKLNLEVLKRHDANICDILDQSPHCVVYKFDTQKTSWEKLGYEGVIFLTQGKSSPYFGLYVLNRLSIENFGLHLTDFEDIALTGEFIIYQTNEGETCALWLYEKKDRERIVEKVLKLHEGMKSLSSVPQQTKTPEPPKVDILQMLKKGSNNSLETTSKDLMKVLNSAQQQPQQQPQQQQPQQQQPPLPPPQLQQQQPSPAEQFAHQQQQQQHHQIGDPAMQYFLQQQGGSPAMRQPMAYPPPPPPQAFTPQAQYLHPSIQVNPPFPPPPPQHEPGFILPNENRPDRAGNQMQEHFNNNNNNNGMMGANSNEIPRRIISNGELTKPFYPPFMSMSPAASPRNPSALLRALHGGTIPLPPVPVGVPLLPQQVIDLMRPEVARRFENKPPLTKPEFIQQMLNMIQSDPSFLEVIYDNYQRQMGPSTL